MQDWDAAVALKLFCTRLSEADQPLAALLLELAEALPASSAAIIAYEAIHASADEAAAAARAAHQQVQEAQVTKHSDRCSSAVSCRCHAGLQLQHFLPDLLP